MPFILLFLLIIVHEIGHFTAALFFKIDVDKIYIYPFGGVSKFNISLNESILKEFIILVMGPLFQMIFYTILIKIGYFYSYNNLLRNYNYTILIFNLLPIYPLDGGRLLNLILSLKISFKKSMIYSVYISYCVIILFCIFYVFKNLSISTFVVACFLFYKVYIENRKINYIFDKFLLERYLKNYSYLKRKKVNNMDEFRRNRYHYIKNNGKYYTEKCILGDKFHNKY